MKNLPICLSCDDNYTQHMGVVITSILMNLSSDYQARFFVLDGGIKDINKEKIESLKEVRNFEIHYINMLDDRFNWDACPIINIPVATYYRFKAPTALPDLDKVLYLDIDIIVDGDIAPLWETDIGQNYLGAVYDPAVYGDFLKEFDITSGKYFNAGVMLLNLGLMRDEKIEDKLFQAIGKYKEKIVHSDQDIINAVCFDKVYWLPPKYNVTNGYTRKHHKKVDLSVTSYSKDELKEAADSPVIIHYIGKRKPWFYTCKHEHARKYMDYLKKTPWKGYKMPDKNIKNILWRMVFLLRRNMRYLLKKCKNI